MVRAVTATLVLAVSATGLAAGASPAASTRTKKCPHGTKRVGKRCKRVKRTSVPSTTISPGRVGGSVAATQSSIYLTPDLAKGTARADVIIVCTTAANKFFLQQANIVTGETVTLTSTKVGTPLSLSGSFIDSGTGVNMTWALVGKYISPARFEGTLAGTASTTTSAGPEGCSVPATKIVLVAN